MPTLQVRKIYRSSNSSCAVTLPSGWLRYLGLRPGDEVEIISNHILKIRPKRKGALRINPNLRGRGNRHASV